MPTFLFRLRRRFTRGAAQWWDSRDLHIYTSLSLSISFGEPVSTTI